MRGGSALGTLSDYIPDRIVHIIPFVFPAVEHWLEPKITYMSTKRSQSADPPHFEQMLYYYVPFPSLF